VFCAAADAIATTPQALPPAHVGAFERAAVAGLAVRPPGMTGLGDVW
jgi:hypothetical protein